MKRRSRYALNLLSLGLLVFALYLNFIRKDVDENALSVSKTSVGKTDASTLKKSTSLSAITPSQTVVLK